MSIRGNILDNFMTDLQLVLHWTRRLASVIILKTMRKHHKSIKETAWSDGMYNADGTRRDDEESKSTNPTPVMQGYIYRGRPEENCLAFLSPRRPAKIRAPSPSYTQILWGLRVCFSRGRGGYRNKRWKKRGRSGHCRRETLHGVKLFQFIVLLWVVWLSHIYTRIQSIYFIVEHLLLL